MINNEPWFVAADICNALDIVNTTRALSGLDDDEQALHTMKGISKGNDNVNIINESGLYSLILRSRKPEAKKFKKWVTSEVLPSIRKTGSYQAPKPQHDLLTKEHASIINKKIHDIAWIFELREGANQGVFNRLRVDLHLRRIEDIRECHYGQAIQILDSLFEIAKVYQNWQFEVRRQAIDMIIHDSRPWTPTIAGKLRKQLNLTISEHPDWRKLASLVNQPVAHP